MKAISIDAVRHLGKQSGATRVIVIALDGEDYGITTWGKTQAECRTLAKWAESNNAVSTISSIANTKLAGGAVVVALDPEATALTPLHIKLLQRGVTSKWIGLSDNMGVRMSEVAALGELHRMGLAEHAKGPFPPGPPSPTPSVITEAGRAIVAKSQAPSVQEDTP